MSRLFRSAKWVLIDQCWLLDIYNEIRHMTLKEARAWQENQEEWEDLNITMETEENEKTGGPTPESSVSSKETPAGEFD